MCFIDVNILSHFVLDSASGWTPSGKELLLGVEDMLEMFIYQLYFTFWCCKHVCACSWSLFIVIVIREWWVGFASENWISTEQEVVRSHGILMTSEDQHDITPDHVICTVSHVT